MEIIDIRRMIITNYDKLLKERKDTEQKIKLLELQIRKLPKGNLLCVHNGKYRKWYQANGKKPIYIPKKNKKLAEQLALRKYLTLQKEELIKEKEIIDSCLKSYDSCKLKSQEMLAEESDYIELLSPYFKPTSKKHLDWMKSPYETNTKYPEQLIHKCHSGNYVRSKSESMIDMILSSNKIPFRYECALELGDVILYPDFTILHPKTDKIYYWEHFGLMEKPEYYKNAYTKMQLYNSYGIVPSIQLIMTFETKDYPLTVEMVERIVEQYFL